MKVAGRFLYHPIQRPGHCIARLAGACLTITVLVVSGCLPITSASLHHKAGASTAVASEPMRTLATTSAGRFAGDTLARLPLRFEACDKRSPERFLARTNESTVYLSAAEATLVLRATAGAGRLGCGADLGLTRNARSPQANEQLPEPRRDRAAPRTHAAATVRMQLVGANRRARVIGENQLATRTSYFIGKDASRWRTNVANYERVKVEQVYSGIDVVYYGSGQQLEYDFKVAPGADVRVIRLRFTGARSIRIDEKGDLLLATAVGVLRQHKPVAYQLVNGARREVPARFLLNTKHEVDFRLGDYDRRLPLVIDPVLSYSTFFGGEASDYILAVVVDAQGNAYVAGTTLSNDLPITPGAFQPNGTVRSGSTGFVAKIDLTNNRLLYSTYLGGAGHTGVPDNGCFALAIDSAGNAYITGETGAADFPTTPNAFQRTLAGGSDAFVSKLNPMGSALVYSTYLGSSKTPVVFFSPLDEGLGIAVDAAGSAYVTGRTVGMDFPVTTGVLKQAHDNDVALVGDVDPIFAAYQDAFVTKLNPTGTGLVYSTYLGGLGDDNGSGIKVDAASNAYVVGSTGSMNFPTSNSPQPNLGGVRDAFIAKLNHDGSALLYSTYVGGTSDDTGSAVAIDGSGNAYVSGTTASTDLPVTAGAFQQASADVSIYKSTNGGASWVLSNVGMPGNASIGGLAVDPANPSSLYTDVFGRVFNSTDGGRRWRSILSASPGTSPTYGLTFGLKKPTTVYGVKDSFFSSQVVKSLNGGQTWERVNTFFPGLQPVRIISALAIDPVNETTIYAVTELGLFKRTDGDSNWIARGKGLPANGAGAAILAIDPRNPDRLFARTSDELFTSTNGGKNWRLNSLSDTTILSLTFDPASASTVYASGAGLFKSTDSGETWQEVDNDLPTFGVGKVVVDPSNALVLYTTTRGGVFKSSDGGRHWIAVNAGLGPNFLGVNGPSVSVSIDPTNPSTLYARGPAAGSDAFVGKLNPSGSAFVYLSYLGGTNIDSATGVAVDSEGNAYLTGQSFSSDFPVSRAFQPDRTFEGYDLFVTKLRADGAGLAYSTYLGGSSQDYSSGIDVDRFGSAHIVGYSFSPDFPLDNSLQSSFRGTEGILARIADLASSQPAPTISAVSPASGSSGGQYAINILGANFLPGARVRIGGVPMTIVEVTSNTIRGIVNGRPTGMIETVDVAVSNPDGQSSMLKNGFTFLPLPRIDVVELSGKELIVFGSGFDKGSVILAEGHPQQTRLELTGELTGILLLSKKAARKIAPGATAVIQVRNVYDLTSAPFSYTRPIN